MADVRASLAADELRRRKMAIRVVRGLAIFLPVVFAIPWIQTTTPLNWGRIVLTYLGLAVALRILWFVAGTPKLVVFDDGFFRTASRLVRSFRAKRLAPSRRGTLWVSTQRRWPGGPLCTFGSVAGVQSHLGPPRKESRSSPCWSICGETKKRWSVRPDRTSGGIGPTWPRFAPSSPRVDQHAFPRPWIAKIVSLWSIAAPIHCSRAAADRGRRPLTSRRSKPRTTMAAWTPARPTLTTRTVTATACVPQSAHNDRVEVPPGPRPSWVCSRKQEESAMNGWSRLWQGGAAMRRLERLRQTSGPECKRTCRLWCGRPSRLWGNPPAMTTTAVARAGRHKRSSGPPSADRAHSPYGYILRRRLVARWLASIRCASGSSTCSE